MGPIKGLLTMHIWCESAQSDCFSPNTYLRSLSEKKQALWGMGIDHLGNMEQLGERKSELQLMIIQKCMCSRKY